MLGEIFYWVLNMSISASVVGIIVLLLCKIKRLPRRLACFIWIIPFIRMTVPFGIGSRFSLMTLISKFTTKTVEVPGIPEDIGDMTVTNHIMAANGYFPITYKVNILEDVFRVAGAVWLTVFAAILLAYCIMYAVTFSELRASKPLYGNVYVSDKVTSPAVYGIFRPRIILPESYSEEGLAYILAHERMHIKRADNLRRTAAFLVTALHWFNPLSWLFLRKYLSEAELACDEGVLSGLDAAQRKEYALTLVNSAASREVFASAFGGAKVRVRVSRILSYKKLSVFSICAFTALAAAVICVLLTNAA